MNDPNGTNNLATNQVTTLDVGPTAPIPETPDTPEIPHIQEAPRAGARPARPSHPVHEARPTHVEDSTDPVNGLGIDGEETVWEGGYSFRNFIGRLVFRGVLTVAWLALALYVWGYDHNNLNLVAIVSGIALVILWIGIASRIIYAKMGHSYRLTTRRLFISTGVFRRERDQLELLQVSDVFTKQNSLSERWFSVGTVVVTASNKQLPTCHILGVSDPKGVMDLVWHHARAEQDQRSVRVNEI